jgi:hypothetical protein
MPNNESSPHCQLVLSKPPACGDFKAERSYAMCLAWKIMTEEKQPRLQLKRAWQEIHKTCPSRRARYE